jgi:double-stranded uracil-DNA glycosylase
MRYRVQAHRLYTMKKVAPRILSPFGWEVFIFHMLPDYLQPNLDIVFVGINPGEYSNRVGHYFARKQNAFWTALNASGLVDETLIPEDDARLPQLGLGLTDIVKRATPNANQVAESEFLTGGKALRAKLEPLAPHIICFVGLVGYRQAFDRTAQLGAQAGRWGAAHLFIVPSTSPRNARYRNEIVTWFKRLKEYRDQLKGATHAGHSPHS